VPSRQSLPDVPATAPLLVQLRALLPALQPGEAKVAVAVRDNPQLVMHSSVSEVAELSGTSTATVVRAAQSLGFKGFHALKIQLVREIAEAMPKQSARPRGALAEVTEAGARCVRDAGALVADDAFDRVVARLAGARRVLFVGVGTSAPLCQDAAYRFSAVGVLAEHRADAHEQAVVSRLLGPEDVCVAVTHTGATRETLEAGREARSAGAGVVVLTSFARSPITELGDDVLIAGTRELGPAGLEAMASRLAHLAVLDALVVAVTEREPARATRALQAYSDVLSEHRL
jgi:DNA-binding MurR/RpiR family transcriptional regulator